MSDNSILYDILNNFLNYNFKYNIIVGDFNFPDIEWPLSSSTAPSDSFLNFIQENYLRQHVNLPTRKASQTILDLVLSTQGTDVSELTVNEEFRELSTSDHSIIEFCIPIGPTHTRKKVYKRNLSKVDWSLFRQLLASSDDWMHVFGSGDIDKIWDHFLSALKSALDSVAPLKIVAVRSYMSSSQVRTALRYKRRCFKALVEESSLINIAAYERSIEIASRAIANDIIKRENRIINNTDSKEFWAYVNRRQSKNCNIDHISSSGADIDDPQSIADIFNNYFSSIFTLNSEINASNILVTQLNPNNLHTISISSNDINKILRLLPPKTSIDNDGLSYKILKEGGNILATYLEQLFSLSLDLGRLPSAWKVGVVTSIHKGGLKTLVSNYRPISVTSCCCRILERIVRNKLTDYLLQHKIITNTQHGFVARRSTDTILLHFYDYVTNKVDNNMVVDSIVSIFL